MSGHTPGPWFLEGNWDPKSGSPMGGWVSYFPPSCGPIFGLTPSVGTPDEICANARLVAAAPDMLAALKGIDDFWTIAHPDGPDGDPTTMGGLATLSDDTLDVWRSIRSAIAKAEGGAK